MELDDVKVRVLQYFIKNTPVGELKEVLNDLSTIMGSEAIHSDTVADLLLDSLAAHGTVIVHEGVSYQLSTYGRNGVSFTDTKHSVSFDVNPYDLTISNINQISTGTSLSRAIQEKLDVYLSQHFSDTAQARVFQYEDSISVFIACASINLRNMWTGEWISEWKVLEGKISGKITINAHYFEEGNLQMNQVKEFDRTFGGSDEETWAAEIVNAIKSCDDCVQNGMYEVYENLPQNVFKPMRRTLPVTHTKFAEMYKMKMLS